MTIYIYYKHHCVNTHTSRIASSLDIKFEIFLTNLLVFGATKSKFMSREVYMHAYTFVGSKFKQIKQWCGEVSERRLNYVGFLWGNLFAKILQVFSYWVNRTHLRGVPLEFKTFQAADSMYWYTAYLVDHDTYTHNVERPKLFEPKGLVIWYNSGYTYLDTV